MAEKRMNLKLLRVAQDINQPELAGDLGVSAEAIRSIEGGRRQPSIRIAKLYALYYNKSLEELFPDIFRLDKVAKIDQPKTTAAKRKK